MRWIYLSPHLDDAILSCGGLIWEQRSEKHVAIWTICAGDSSASQVPVDRRAEDVAACQVVGAGFLHLSIPDCIYRAAQDGSLLYNPNTVAGVVHAEDEQLVEAISALLAARLEPDDTLVCPLALGGHVDHRLTRLAAERLNIPLRYYADVPYVIENPAVPETLQMQAKIYPVSDAGLRVWQDGVAAYSSQVGGLFGGPEKMRAAIQSYWRDSFGVRLWKMV